MLEIILASFEQEDNEHQPFDYWESVIGDEFSHTVENIFYMSFLMKEDIITAWVSFSNKSSINKSIFVRSRKTLAKYSLCQIMQSLTIRNSVGNITKVEPVGKRTKIEFG